MHRFIASVGLSVGVGLGLVRVTNAQEIASASYERGPRFLLATATKVVPVDVSKTPVLARRLNLELEGATLKQALAEIAAQSGLVLAYSDDAVPLEKRVHLRAEAITAAAALTDVLFDAGVDVVFKADGSAALVRRPPPAQNGSIEGKVTDSQTSQPIVGAAVIVPRTSMSTNTDNDGRYKLAEVAPGTYTVQVRYIGYSPKAAVVTVIADQVTSADFALEKAAQQLNELVTTGTVVPTEVRALPTPISVITSSDITAQAPRTVQEVFRQAVPTAVSWDLAPYPSNTPFSVRGASSINPGNAQMKLFVDGIEVAYASFAPIDPASIERIEVVRGPQAAAIYGSDAVGGVIQVFTKRGNPALVRPEINAEAGVGLIQSPYTSYGGAVRQSYKVGLNGGAPNVSYNFGGGYAHTGEYVPDGEQSNPSAYGGVHFLRGMMAVDVSGRYQLQNNPQTYDPALYGTGLESFSKPFYQHFQYQNQAYGVRLTLTPSTWWHHALTLGVDRLVIDAVQTQRRFTSPSDTLLFLFNQSQTKTSVGYNTSVQGGLGSGATGSLAIGFDHYSLPTSQYFTSGAGNITGTVQIATGFPFPVSRSTTNNTGYFAQAQLGLWDALFLTGGIRAESNTNFGESLGTPVSPRVGLSYARDLGAASVKVRGSYGRAIRAPLPGQQFATATPSSVTLVNPQLGPERQRGWDTGFDIVFGTHGSFGFTYYNQRADDLIQSVLLGTNPVQTFQFQNVGRVRNFGVELEGMVTIGPVNVRGQYGYARSRVDQLAPGYAGDLRVGDQSLLTPKHTAGAAVSVAPFTGTTIAAGATYVGHWTNYDQLALFRCFGGTGPCRATSRDYLMEYPDFVKLNARVAQQITPLLSGFVTVDNLANNQQHESINIIPVMGRVTTVGVRLQY